MIRYTVSILSGIALLVSAPILRAQDYKVVWVDFEKAVVESAEGKKASERFNATLQAKQNDVDKRQKDLEDAQKKLQNGARTLSDSAKGDLQKDIDKKTTELKRINEDGQKELQTMRDELLRPIAERATAILQAMSADRGYTLVIDVSNPESNVLWANPKNDVTAELVKLIDVESAKQPAKSEAPKPTTPNAPGANPGARPATQTNPAPPNQTRPAAPPATAPKNP